MMTRDSSVCRQLKVFVDAVPFHIRQNHTDLSLLRSLSGIQKYFPELSFEYPTRWLPALAHNVSYLSEVVRYRFPSTKRWFAGNPFAGFLDLRALRESRADVIYSHGRFPRERVGRPILWRNTILDPEMQRSHGASCADIAREIEAKRPLFQQSTLIQVSTDAELKRMESIYPDQTGKFVSIPYFLGYLDSPFTAEDVRRKLVSDEVNILFVGRHGYRKGLDKLMAAIAAAGLHKSRLVKITVVSDLSDGHMTLPSFRNLTHIVKSPRREILQLLKNATILAMPSRFESYGIAFVEAMASGAITIAPKWEVQSEIVDYGRAGFAATSVEEIATALTRILDSRELRLTLGLRALDRFNEKYAPRVVAEKFARAFDACVNG